MWMHMQIIQIDQIANAPCRGRVMIGEVYSEEGLLVKLSSIVHINLKSIEE